MPEPTGLRPASWDDILTFEAKKAKVPPTLARAVMQQESGGDPTAISPKGARGLMQLMPETAADLGVDPDDPQQNIRGGVTYLRRMLDEQGGDVAKALSAYNAGPKGNWQNPETQDYVQRILGRLQGTTPAGTATPHRVRGQAPEVGVPPPPVIPPYQRPAPGTVSLPEPGPTSRFEEATQIGGQVLSAFDPRERQGRRNWAAAAGGAVGAALTGGIGVLPVLAGAATAGTFAGTAEATEQLVEGLRTGKPEEAYKPLEPFKAAGRAAAEEIVGGAGAGVVRGVTTRLWAIPVAKKAAAGINQKSQAVLTSLKSGLDQVTAGLKTTSRRAAGQAAAGVRAGPATRTYKDIGESVGEAARTGPAVPAAPLRQRLEELGKKLTLAPAKTGSGLSPEEIAQIPGFATASPARQAEMLAKTRTNVPEGTLGLPIPEDHPLRGLLGQVQAALGTRETIPFPLAHEIKLQLDAAVNWEHPAKSMVEQATKAVRKTLRSDMAAVGHHPYERATAAYDRVTDLFREGYGEKLGKLAELEPANFIDAINPREPTQTAMLRDLLTTVPAQQGQAGAQQGTRAWDAVRHAWTYDRLINGDPEKLPERLAKLDPDFVQEFFRADPTGQQVYENLAQIGNAFSTKRDEVNALVEEFRKSTLTLETKGNAIERLGADLSRVAFLGPQSFWGASSFMRVILEKPSGKELLRWATFNNNGAAPLLARVLNHPSPGTAAADLLRLFNRDHGLPEPMGLPPPSSQPGEISLSISNRPVGTPPPPPR